MTQAVGKRHCGENKESQPHNVGFDHGFLGWSGHIPTGRTKTSPRASPSPAPEYEALVKEVPFNDHIVHGVKGKVIENLEQITIELSAELDEKFATYSRTS